MTRLVCLLPVRNGAHDIPGWLTSAQDFADAVIALDDGSTDGSGDLLADHPLVVQVLRNPPRPTAAGWNDSANRNRLLAAAASLDPEWIISIDADERLDEADGRALVEFLDGDALPGCAYGLRHVRMWGTGNHDPDMPLLYRLFAYAPGQRFPDQRLHFDPVPVSIPRSAWIPTNIRLQHVGASTPEGIEQRRAKYAEADPVGEYRTDFAGLDAAPSRLVAWAPRPPGLHPLAAFDAESASDAADHDPSRPALVCLVPVRNGEHDLPAFFESVARFADAIVALDDGSTDSTRRILESRPLVRTVLTNERRESYAGWDDAANRRRLLEAASDLNPRWILMLDADERIDEGDAIALRDFIESGAVPGHAYGFRVFRMIGEDSYDRADLSVFRLFAYEPSQALPDDRLHFVPIPRSIDPKHFVETTLRIQHVAGTTDERRHARFAKYAEADPDLSYQRDYANVIEAPGTLRLWRPRPENLPVVLPAPDQDIDLDAPVLSAVIIARDDEARIERTVRSVVDQECPEPFEVIVVTSGTDRTAEIVRTQFPQVQLIELDTPALPGRARNAGLRAARGDYVSFPGSHVELLPGSLAARIRAHERGYPLVTGTAINGTRTAAGWASYFLDNAVWLPGRPSGELSGPPARCSYLRDALIELGGFPEDMRAGEDTVVNTALWQRGYRAYRCADVSFVHTSPCTRPMKLLTHHFARGRAMGRIVLERRPDNGRVLGSATLRSLLPYVFTRIRRTSASVRQWGGDLVPEYARVRTLVWAGAVAAWLGMWFEIVRPGRGKLRQLFMRSAFTVLVAGLDRRDTLPVGRSDLLLLVRVEPFSPKLWITGLPRDLFVDVPGVGPCRLNESYYWGAARGGHREGARLLERTVASLGISVDAHVVLDLDGFVRVIDGLGGIDVDVPHDIHDEFVGEDGALFSAHFTKGRQHLAGDEALLYVRTRKADGDRFRRSRHRQVLRAVMQKASRSPVRAVRAAVAARRGLTTSLGVVRLLAIAQAVRRLKTSSVVESDLAEPAVRSERTVKGKWVHTGDPVVVSQTLRSSLGLSEPVRRR